MYRFVILLLLAGCVVPPNNAAFPLLHNAAQPKNPWAGKEITLKGEFIYSKITSSRVPAVLLMNGVNGLEPQYGLPQVRYWASWFRALGFATLIMDSYTPRGLPQNIKNMMPDYGGDQTNWFSEVQRTEDPISAYYWLSREPLIDSGRIYVVGFSHGGGTVLALWARPEGRMFAGLIDFYGSCNSSHMERAITDFEQNRPKRTPLLILVGDRDRWQAIDCSKRLINDGVTGEVLRYTAHGFDYPGMNHNEQALQEAYSLIRIFLQI